MAHLASRGIPLDSGVSQRWARVYMFGIPIVFPNFDARRRILFTHDVHHLLTGYDVTWTGEAEIGAFEIVTGCRHFWAAWFFNLGGYLFGLVIAPRRMFRAVVRARTCRNFYGDDEQRIGALTVAAARSELGLDRAPGRATLVDAIVFGLWAVAIVALYVAAPLLAVLWFVL